MKKIALAGMLVFGCQLQATWHEIREKVTHALEQEFAEDWQSFEKSAKERNRQRFEDPAVLAAHAHQISYELKIFSKGILKKVIRSWQSFDNCQKKILSGLEDGSIKTFNELIACFEAPLKEVIDDTAVFLATGCNEIELLKREVAELLDITKKYKEKAYACLQSIEPISFDKEMTAELQEELKKYSMTSEKATKLTELIDSISFDTIFMCLEKELKCPKDQSQGAEFIFSAMAFSIQAYFILKD